MRIVTEDGRILEIPDNSNQAEIDSVVDDYQRTLVGNNPSIPIPERYQAVGEGIKQKGMDFLEGAQQSYYGMQHPLIGQPQLDELAQQRTARREPYEALREQMPLETGVGEGLAYLPSAAIPGGLMTQAGIGAGMEAVQYGDRDPTEAALWSAGGFLTGKMAPRVWKVIKGTGDNLAGRVNRMTRTVTGQSPQGGFKGQIAEDVGEAETRLLQRADEMDMFVYPSARKGSQPLSQIEQSAKASPFLSGMTEDQIRGNRVKLDKLALRAIGEAGEEFTDDTFGMAADRIGKVYDDAAMGKDIPVQLDDLDALRADISQEAEQLLDRYIKKYPELESGFIRGEQFNRLRNRVSQDIRTHLKRPDGDPESLSQIQDVLDEGLKMVSPESLPRLRKAGQQWKNLKALEATGALTPDYHVNARAVGNRLRNFDKGGFMRGKNKDDYYDALRIARRYPDMFTADPARSSNTAQLSWLMRAAQDPSTVGGGMLMRPIYKSYLESGGDLGYATMLGAVPKGVSAAAGQTGGAGGRAFGDAELLGAEFPELK